MGQNPCDSGDSGGVFVIDTRIVLVALFTFAPFTAAFAGWDSNGLFNRKSRPDPARVRTLAEVIRVDTDAKKRREAVVELGAIDPRVNADVMPALIGALKRDEAESVRVTAAEVIAQHKTVFPVAGAALESAATDRSPLVRNAAKQALWAYHLNGYRSATAAEKFTAQTDEPPLALPAMPIIVPSSAETVVLRPPTETIGTVARPIAELPGIVPPGPRQGLFPKWKGIRALLPASLLPSLAKKPATTTGEPPIAARDNTYVPPAITRQEPPMPVRHADMVIYGKRPTLIMELPPIVPHPGVIPGTSPLPQSTSEPPLRKPAGR